MGMGPTRRRQFLIASGAFLVAPQVSCQDASKARRVGLLCSADAVTYKPYFDAFREALRGLGWVEGKNIVIEIRYAEGEQRRLMEMARDLVGRGVEILLPGTTPGVVAAREANPVGPIVMTGTIDAHLSGLVDDLSRPGGNITGLTVVSLDLMAKRLSLLKEAIPSVARLGYLHPGMGTNPQVVRVMEAAMRAIETAAQRLGIELQAIAASGADQIEAAFARFATSRVHAVYVIEGSLAFHRVLIATLALKSRLPTMFGTPIFVAAGGLMSYGADLLDLYRRAATYVDKILKGARAGDLPVEQPTRYELVVNAKTAQALGLTLPPAILMRVDRRIE
jgi:putative ABC transport system substrate-binding protein